MAAIDDLLADLRKEMEGTLVAMRREMSRTRTGRASSPRAQRNVAGALRCAFERVICA